MQVVNKTQVSDLGPLGPLVFFTCWVILHAFLPAGNFSLKINL